MAYGSCPVISATASGVPLPLWFQMMLPLASLYLIKKRVELEPPKPRG